MNTECPAQFLAMLAHSSEFENVAVREEELPELDAMCLHQCPFDVKGGPENKHGKVNILLQVALPPALPQLPCLPCLGLPCLTCRQAKAFPASPLSPSLPHLSPGQSRQSRTLPPSFLKNKHSKL